MGWEDKLVVVLELSSMDLDLVDKPSLPLDRG